MNARAGRPPEQVVVTGVFRFALAVLFMGATEVRLLQTYTVPGIP